MARYNGKYWCFTINNPASDLEFDDRVAYAAWQKERGDNGTEHFQGYIEMARKGRMSAVKNLNEEMGRAHLEPRRGSAEQARDYAMKEDTRIDGPWEHGTWAPVSQGARTDLSAAVVTLREHGIKRVAEEHPVVYVKAYKGLKALERELEEVETDDGFVPRAWQQRLLDIVAEQPGDREIVWVHDSVGNTGKSRLARHLVANHGAIMLSGRVQDMSYAYGKQRIVVFDVPRTDAENIKHLLGMAEKLKNGMFCSTKYDSRMVVFKPPHCIFFANIMPPEGAWSADRLRLIDLDAELPNSPMHMGLGDPLRFM